LAQIDQNILPYILFPFGDKIKQNLIANIDKNSPLYQIAQNKQSSEICFVQDTYIQVLQKHTNTQQNGNVLDKNGNIIGKHKGYMHYTIGKRKGFDVPLAQVPQYVNKIDSKNNTITVGVKESLKINHIKGTKVVMYKDITDFKCQVKIRYRSKAIPATISIDNNQATIRFLENVYGVAIGQYAVFYDNDLLIGSCQITKSFLD
jgi:tRNA-specific 2-thiouridylase